MAAVLKPRLLQSVKARLNKLGYAYAEGVESEDSWIAELVFKPGEPRIMLLQWLLSKYDFQLGELVDNQRSTLTGSKMDSRIQRLLFVFSNLGLCRYDDVDLIRGIDSSATSSSTNRQIAFIDQLLDIVVTKDFAEDPLTKSLLMPGVLSESSTLGDQMAADCSYMDAVAPLTVEMFKPTVELIPHDIRRAMEHNRKKDGSLSDPPSLTRMTDLCGEVEKSLARQLHLVTEYEEVQSYQSGNQAQRAGKSLDLILGELSQLVLSFTYCYESEMLPWCNKTPPVLSQLGPAFKRVHTLLAQFSKMLQGLQQIHQSSIHLSQGVTDKLNLKETQNTDNPAFLAEVSQAAASSFLECVSILDESVQHEHASILSTSLYSSKLKL